MTPFFLVLNSTPIVSLLVGLTLAFMILPVSFADLPTPWQMLFQDPLTLAMEGIVDLHHDICFFLITILILVLWLGARIVSSFHYTRMPIPERFNHHTNLELVWAILPSLIVTMILLPSLTLIYTFDDLILKPRLTIKITGRQWFWSYRMDEHVHSVLVNPDALLSDSLNLRKKEIYFWSAIFAMQKSAHLVYAAIFAEQKYAGRLVRALVVLCTIKGLLAFKQLNI